MKLKQLLKETKAWERKFGESLPVLELKFGSKAQYDKYKKNHNIKDGTKIEIDGKKVKSFSFNKFQFEKEIPKNGLVKDCLKAKQTTLVQIIKEPISTKGPRLSSEISLAGRFMVP